MILNYIRGCIFALGAADADGTVDHFAGGKYNLKVEFFAAG